MKTKKILIAEFSQTGSTLKVGDEIAMGLKTSGYDVDFHLINGKSLPDLTDFEIIGIGTPVYAFRPPYHVMDFVKALPDLTGKSFFVYVLHGTHPGKTGNVIRKCLKKKHGRDIGYFLCHGPDYFVGYIKYGYLFSPDSPTKHEIETAFRFGKLVVRRMESDLQETEKYDPPTPLVYSMERFSTNRIFTRWLYTKVFKANSTCDGCQVCIKKCPTHNIVLSNDKRPVWNKNCILCATCEIQCPKDAITSCYDWGIFAPFMAYNIHTAKKKEIPYTKVRHAGGKTMRISDV